MFESIIQFFKNIGKKEENKENQDNSRDAAKERLHLVLMQDRANVSSDFLELMRQEIIDVIKKYLEVDEQEIDVKLTNKENEDGTNGAPALYANIPILNIKSETRAITKKDVEKMKEEKKNKEEAEDVIAENEEKEENTEKKEELKEDIKKQEKQESESNAQEEQEEVKEDVKEEVVEEKIEENNDNDEIVEEIEIEDDEVEDELDDDEIEEDIKSK